MYRLFGMEVSPYSVKVRALLRHKQLPHEWVLRSRANEAAFREKAKVPLIPLLVTPEGEGLQDSTPLLDLLETRHPERGVTLADPLCELLARALEEAADEWLIKPMFHYRWNYAADREDAALRIARASVDPGTDPAPFAQLIGGVLMSRRDGLGCSDHNGALFESLLATGAALLDRHLATRPWIFGGQLSLADLGLGSMYYELLSDPTPAGRLAHLKHLRDWAARSMDPQDGQGAAEPLSSLLPTLQPLLRHELSDGYLPWAAANAEAAASGHDSVSVTLGNGETLAQPVQKYTLKSWNALRQRAQALSSESRHQLTELLGDAARLLLEG